MSNAEKRIRLEHGSGGFLSRELVEQVIYPRFRRSAYPSLNDATALDAVERPFLTTDSFVVDPIEFPGGNIGELAVFGTCNDLAVSGARPVALTLGCILEEGLPVAVLERILDSIVRASDEVGVSIVTGDTKVVPRGTGGGIYLNSAGLGSGEFEGKLTDSNISDGDAVILSGNIGAHGIAVLAAREQLPVAKTIVSDCGNLFPACRALYDLGADLRVMRDATRGGVSSVLNELVSGREVSILLDEPNLPVSSDVRAAADILGLNPLEIANEGVFAAVVAAPRADEALALLRATDIGSQACIVGRVVLETKYRGRVILETAIGGRRIVDIPRGLLLPRIC